MTRIIRARAAGPDSRALPPCFRFGAQFAHDHVQRRGELGILLPQQHPHVDPVPHRAGCLRRAVSFRAGRPRAVTRWRPRVTAPATKSVHPVLQSVNPRSARFSPATISYRTGYVFAASGRYRLAGTGVRPWRPRPFTGAGLPPPIPGPVRRTRIRACATAVSRATRSSASRLRAYSRSASDRSRPAPRLRNRDTFSPADQPGRGLDHHALAAGPGERLPPGHGFRVEHVRRAARRDAERVRPRRMLAQQVLRAGGRLAGGRDCQRHAPVVPASGTRDQMS